MPRWSDFTRLQRGLLIAVAVHAVLYTLAIVLGEDVSLGFIITQPMLSLFIVTAQILDARRRKREREIRAPEEVS